MATVTFKGTPVPTAGNLPAVGQPAPDFSLTTTDMSDVNLKNFSGKTVVLNIFPSVDTPVCAMTVRKFNAEIGRFDHAVVLCVSRDLPFAHARFCGAEGLDNVISVSELRTLDFGERYGVRITGGPLAGLMARAVVIVDGKGIVRYTQLVAEIAEEPNYDDALAVLRQK